MALQIQNQAVAYTNFSGTIIDVNEQFSSASGISVDRLIGQHITAIMRYNTPEELMESAHIFEQLADAGNINLVWRATLKLKTNSTVVATLSDTRNNGRKVIAVVLDETTNDMDADGDDNQCSKSSRKGCNNQKDDSKQSAVSAHVIPNVFIVDDSEVVCKIVSKIMTDLGYSPTTAKNGLECLNEIKRRGPNFYSVILMDIYMPVMGGMETVYEIRKWEQANKFKGSLTESKIIAISDPIVNMEMIRELQKTGCPYFMPKPFTKEKFVDIMATIQAQEFRRDTLSTSDEIVGSTSEDFSIYGAPVKKSLISESLENMARKRQLAVINEHNGEDSMDVGGCQWSRETP